MFIQVEKFSPAQLRRFLQLQRLSFTILESTAAELTAGQTEKEVARTLVKRYREAGFTSFFHLPVVLFGERAALPGNFTVGKFFPKSRALASNDSVIFDASPISSGYLVDTSYSFCFGQSLAHRKMMQGLAQFREQVCTAVNRRESFKAIAEQVAAGIQAMGYEAVHCKHPGEVLGHRAVKLPDLPFALRYKGFDAMSLAWFGLKNGGARTGLGRRSPLWNTTKYSDHKPHDGLWLVEPHAGSGEVGAKWEEILVIEKGNARWLDDEPPHVKQFAQISRDQDYRPEPGDWKKLAART